MSAKSYLFAGRFDADRDAAVATNSPPIAQPPCRTGASGIVGMRAVKVPRADGSPAWPAGVVGSMTHCAGYRAAAVGSAHRYAGIGIDVEPAVPLSAAVQELIVRDEERRFAFGVYSKVLFSAKEAALKTWYPLGFRGFDVSDISIACDVESGAWRGGEDARGTFTARIPTMPDAPVLPGGWAIGGGFVATAASLSASNLPANR